MKFGQSSIFLGSLFWLQVATIDIVPATVAATAQPDSNNTIEHKKNHNAAERIFAEAEQLSQPGKAESKRQVIADYHQVKPNPATLLAQTPTQQSPTTRSQASEQPLQRVQIAEVAVKGAEQKLQDLVYKTISIKPGDAINRLDLDLDIQAIYKTGFFSDVKAVAEDRPLGVRVTFIVQPYPVLRNVAINIVPQGNQVLPQSIVEKSFSNQYGNFINLNSLREGIDKLNQWYREKGYVLAEVDGEPKFANDGTVTLTVKEGIIEDIKLRFLTEDGKDKDVQGKPIIGETPTSLILSTFGLKPGEVYTTKFRNGLDSLKNLGVFDDVSLWFEQSKEPGKIFVVLKLIERKGDKQGLLLFGEGKRLSRQESAAELEQALGKFEQALKIFREKGDRYWEGVTIGSIGSIYYSSAGLSLNEPQKAINYYNQSLKIFREIKNQEQEMIVLASLANTHDLQGEYQQALNLYEQALKFSRSLKQPMDEGKWVYKIGQFYRKLGDDTQALYFFKQVIDLIRYEQGKDAAGLRGATFLEIGHIYTSRNEYEQALDSFNTALGIFKYTGWTTGQAMVLTEIGKTYIKLDKKQQALDSLNQALKLMNIAKDSLSQGLIFLSIGGVYLNSFKDYQQALNYNQQALKIFRNLGDLHHETESLHGIAFIYSGMGKYQQAIDFYNQVLSRSRAKGDRAKETSALYNTALSESKQGNLGAALNNIEAAIKIVESLRTNVASQQLRTSYFASVQDYYKLKIDLLMQLHKQNPVSGYDGKALQASESGKARSMLELLNEARADIRTGVDYKLVEAERNLQLKLDTLEKRRLKLYSSNSTQEQAKQIAFEQEQLLFQYQDIQTKIRAASPRYAALTQPESLTLQQIQSTILDDNTLLLEYSLGKERSYLWAVSKNSINSYELPPRAEIEAAVRKFEEEGLVQVIRPKRAAQAANALSQILLSPVAEKLNNKRLVIVADGILQSLPFSALAVPNSTQQDTVFVPLIVEHEIVNLPSASTLAVLRRDFSGRKVAPKAIAIFADPVFSKDDQRVSGVPTPASSSIVASSENVPITQAQLERSTRESGVTLKRLPGTRIEAEAIMAMVPESQRTQFFDFKVTKNTATSPDLSQYQILHFATHGILNTTTPELSGVVMSLVDEKGIPQNGFLRLNDIFNLNLPAELVVLSACETGQGKEVKGEGIIGLTRGFMYAGAPRVVVSLWSVDDTATAELMKRFYQKILQEKLTPSAALRASQIEMSQIPQWSNPYYWAAFVLQGEWK